MTRVTNVHSDVPTSRPRVALCQLAPRSDASLESNYLAAEALVRRGASLGADLCVLPEYALALPRYTGDTSWADRDGAYLRRYCALAAELGVNLVPGTIGEFELDPSTGDSVLCNNTYYIDRVGTVLCTYRKKNLWGAERSVFVRGVQEHAVFDTREFGRVGLLICWDLGFPEAFRALVRDGVQTVIAPTYWQYADGGPGLRYNARSEAVYLDALLTTRAFENEVVLIFCNAGSDDAQGPVGLSQVTAPFVGKLFGIPDARTDVVVGEIDYAVLPLAEEVYGVRADVLSDDWHY